MCRRHLLAVLLSAAALAPLARAAEPVATIGGVTFDGRSQVGGQSLVLNGVGARAVAVFKAYVAALYLPRRAQTVEAIAAMPGAKRLQMRMFYDIPMAEFAKAFRKGVSRNTAADEVPRLAARMEGFDRSLEEASRDLGDTAWKSFRNLPSVHVLTMGELNTYDVLVSDFVVFTEATLPGASVAGVAMSHGINANIVHRWLRERAGQASSQSGFVALSLPPAKSQLPPLGDGPAKPEQDIRIELRRGATVVNVAWPASQASECAAWMRELLR